MNETTNLKSLKPYGGFSTYNDDLTVFLPVPNKEFDRFSTTKPVNISSKQINAILMTVSDDTPASRADENPTHVIQRHYKISDLFNTPTDLSSHQAILVIAYNTIDPFTDQEIVSIKKCVESISDYQDYKQVLACLDSLRKDHTKDKNLIRPNEKKGNILKGI